MKFFWIIPFFLLQDTEAFLMKNAKVKLCLQASPMNGDLLLEDCNPESDFQDWSWQVGSSQGYLVANRKGVTLDKVRGLKAQWQDVADRSVCKEKAAEAEQDRYFPAALASTDMYDSTAGNVTLTLGIDPEELEELLWFFRREDSSTWNYSVLALSFVAMILGLLLLAINIVRNRKRKIHMYREVETMQQAELEAKQTLMPVQEYSPAEPGEQEVVPQDQRPGEVVVQWKDGTVTSLYTERSEDAM